MIWIITQSSRWTIILLNFFLKFDILLNEQQNKTRATSGRLYLNISTTHQLDIPQLIVFPKSMWFPAFFDKSRLTVAHPNANMKQWIIYWPDHAIGAIETMMNLFYLYIEIQIIMFDNVSRNPLNENNKRLKIKCFL